MKTFKWLKLVFIAALILQSSPVKAQTQQPSQPVYIVQAGDTLSSIAGRFGVSVNDLIIVNNLTDPNRLDAGTQLVIPGLEGVSGVLMTETVPFGDNLESLSRQYQVPTDLLVRLNRITSPEELYAGSNLIIPQQDQAQPLSGTAAPQAGQSLLELAVMHGVNPWMLSDLNGLSGTWEALPGEVLYYSSQDQTAGASAVSPAITSIDVAPLPLVQGKTTEIKVKAPEQVTLGGELDGHKLNFFPESDGLYVALQGIYAMDSPGLYPLTIQGSVQGGASFSFTQNVVLESGNYPSESINGVDPETLDPTVTTPEEKELDAIVSVITPQRYWDGVFQVPGYDPNWITSWFGTRRSYNGGPYNAFHTGLDYGGGTGLPIKAPAAGVVVFAGPLIVRGNAVIIDHGWGVFSGLYHQSEIDVKVGERVEPGQVIGLYGATGRVTGAHLHWDLWVNGVQIDPQDWLANSYP